MKFLLICFLLNFCFFALRRPLTAPKKFTPKYVNPKPFSGHSNYYRMDTDYADNLKMGPFELTYLRKIGAETTRLPNVPAWRSAENRLPASSVHTTRRLHNTQKAADSTRLGTRSLTPTHSMSMSSFNSSAQYGGPSATVGFKPSTSTATW